jgi:hypothetical protein
LEINPDNKKLGRSVYCILLSDMLLVAYRKRKQSNKRKMIIERAWQLQDISVIDLKDYASGNNRFKGITILLIVFRYD